MTEDLGQFLKNLKGRNLALKMEAVLELGRLKDKSAVPALVEALADPEIRALACWALGRIGEKTTAPRILVLLADKDPLVRHEAVLALARIRDGRAAKPLAKLLHLDPVEKVREECAEALAVFPSKMAVSALKKAAESDPSKLVRERANRSLVQLRLKELGIIQPL